MQPYEHQDLTDFQRRPYRSKRLKEYYARMSKDRDAIIYDDNVADALKNQGFAFDETPRSLYKVSKLYDALAGFRPNQNLDPEPSSELNQGIALARACFAKPSHMEFLHVLPFTPATIVKITSNPTGSPGLTNYGCTKAESQTRALERGLQVLKGEKAPEPCLAFARTQFNDKTRLVWGFPYSMTAIEGLVAYPLIERFKGGSTPMAFAMSTMALGTKLRVAAYHSEWAYSLDMSQFDATLSARLIRLAFSILRTWYDLDEIEPVSGLTVKEIFRMIERYFIHTTIVMPDGYLYLGKEHGVPSGSYFTQMVDSIANVIIGGTIAAKFHMHVSKREVFVLGDDLLMWSNSKVSLDKIAEYAQRVLHVKLHGSEKSECKHFDEAIHYLGRVWQNGLPSLDESEILARMVYPERFRVYSSDPCERQREVKMLILSYASVYREGWHIATKLLGVGRNVGDSGGCIDVGTYLSGRRNYDINFDHLSGLHRYMSKYLRPQTKADIPHTAIQYWL